MFKKYTDLIQTDSFWKTLLESYEESLSNVDNEREKELVRNHYVDKILNIITLIKENKHEK